jgi:hypothetical protein
MPFKILSLDVDHHGRPGYDSITTTVKFETTEVALFGHLLEYYKVVVVKDPDAVEAHYEAHHAADKAEGRDFWDDFEDIPERPGYKLYKPKRPSPYDIGLMYMGWASGSGGCLRRVEDPEDGPWSKVREGPGVFEFCMTTSDCLVTRACVLQLAEMQDEMERGHCRYGDFPDQAGAFRSGSTEDDFVGLLQTLYRFWD